MASPSITITYFNGKGRAEISRLNLKYAGIEFTDERLEKEEWGKRKAEGWSPTGQLPVITVDGKRIGQSKAMEYYTAKIAGLIPEDPVAAALVFSARETLGEAAEKVAKAFYNPDEEAKKALLEEFATTDAPALIAKLNNIRDTAGNQEFFVTSEVSFADICLFHMMSFVKMAAPGLGGLDAYEAIVAKVGEIPNIKAWVESRPVTAL